MDITIHASFDAPDASLAFYRDALGFEVRNDVGQGKMRWITVGPAGQARKFPGFPFVSKLDKGIPGRCDPRLQG